MTAILKVCTCGARYSASQWNDLHLVGPLTGGGEDGDEVIGEMRNCAACLSTIAVTVEDIADAETIPPPASGHARAAEQWFLRICVGQTPNNSIECALAFAWVREWQAARAESQIGGAR
jgi:hypothetical protein